jgi:ribosomal protein S18 acetylase RimI-like enzyme
VSIRPATEDDHDVLHELWAAFQRELEPPEWWDMTWEEEWDGLRKAIASDDALVLLAELDGEIAGYAVARRQNPRRAHLNDIYIRPAVRRRGVAKELIAVVTSEMRERGAEVMTLGVDLANTTARTVYRRLGFREDSVRLIVDLTQLQERLSSTDQRNSLASTHVQTDDVEAVQRALAQFLPRLGRAGDAEVSPARNGWVAVTHELFDRDRDAQRRLGRELSERLGVPVVAIALEEEAVVRFLLYERGRMVDEYLSVPSYYGDLNKADELALAANPTLVARLTGADPARVRAVARTASSPADLPPARELLQEVAATMGLEVTLDR